VPVPAPQADAQGTLVHLLAGKPAAIVTRLPGGHRLTPEVTHAAQVGAMLAKMHVAGATFEMTQSHSRGLDWWAATVPVVLPHASSAQAALLRSELAFQQNLAASTTGQALPRGPIHADLFRDNVMFDDTAGPDTLCGFFDFYFAGTDTFLFDLAVCLNDWCLAADGVALDDTRANAFVHAYERVRPLSAAERQSLPAMLRAAALRFWISRLWDWHLPRTAALLKPKDPAHFEHLLAHRVAAPWSPSSPSA
jgi:homoserine kinase type II